MNPTQPLKVFEGEAASLPEALTSPLRSKTARGDAYFRWLTAVCALVVPLIMIAIGLALLYYSLPALRKFGINFFLSEEWNPVTQQFGALSSIYGTLMSTLIAMLLAVPLSLAIAILLVELAPPAISRTVGTMIELLAAIPSIIYGMWGMFVFAPLMAAYIQPWLTTYVGWIPGIGRLFQGPPMGLGMLSAGLILGFMVLPFTCAITRDVFQMVPPVVKESAYGLGATTWEVTYKVTIPYGLVGIIGAFFLGLGRALGETMAVTFVIGNAHKVNLGLFYPGNSIASCLANEFAEATELIYISALICLGLVLFVITYAVQVVSQMLLRRMYRAWSVGL
ncbi:MAG: phosphate ABC transporter permease subunit PstC [Desulfobaccales bacterium]